MRIRIKTDTYGGTKRTDLPDSAFAGPGRSFPIVTTGDVRAAVSSLGRTKHDKAAVKRGIIRRARAIGAADALPETWRVKDFPAAPPGGNYGSGEGGLFANPALESGRPTRQPRDTALWRRARLASRRRYPTPKSAAAQSYAADWYGRNGGEWAEATATKATGQTENHTGVMIALYPPSTYATVLGRRITKAQWPEGTAVAAPDDLHMTLAYLGKTDDLDGLRDRLVALVTAYARQAGRLRLALTGVDRFPTTEDDDTNAVYAAIAKTPNLITFRAGLVRYLATNGMPVDQTYPDYTPHMTLAYVPQDQPTPAVSLGSLSIPVATVTVCWGDEQTSIPLGTATKQTIKAPNYGAHAGQVIAGQLARGNDGKFTAAGNAPATPAPPAPTTPAPTPPRATHPKKAAHPKKGRKPKAPKKPKLTPEQRATQHHAQQEANRAHIASATGMPEGVSQALSDFADPKEPQALSAQNAKDLEARGLVERDQHGAYRLTGAGSAYVHAAHQGNGRAAADALSRAGDRKAAHQQRDTARVQRQQQRDARRAEVQRRRAERLAKRQQAAPKKGNKRQPAPATPSQPPTKPSAPIGTFGRSKKAADPPSTFTVFKDARGQWRWLAQTTTAFEDRDKEIISQKALADDCARADADGLYGPLRWWHIGTPDPRNTRAPWGAGMDIGFCDFNAMSGRTLIESGTFKTAALGQWAASVASKLGLSPGFFHSATEPDPSGVYGHIRRFERSLAPQAAVSNPFTAFHTTRATRKETSVDIEKIKTLLDLGLDSATIKSVLDGVDTTEKTATQAGVRYKTADTPAEPEEITINGVVYTVKAPPVAGVAAVPPPAAKGGPPEAEAKAPGDTLMQEADDDEAAEQADDEQQDQDLIDMNLTQFRQEMGALIDSKLAPVLAQLGLASKMEKMIGDLSGEVKSHFAPAAATKAADPDPMLQEVASLKARLAQLEGGRTRQQVGHQASTADATATTKAADLAVESQPQPLSELDKVLDWTTKGVQNAFNGFVPPSVTPLS
jgi:2'-5' RNA ligase